MLQGIPSLMVAQSSSVSSLLTGLQVYYALSDTSDATGGGLTLTNHNAVTFTAGKINDAANFASASFQYLTRADNAAFQMGTSDFTIAAWVKFTTTNTAVWFCQYGDVANGYGFSTGSVAGKLRPLIASGGNNAFFNSANAWNDGNWHLVVVRYNRAGTMTIFVDNVSEASGTITAESGSVNNSLGFSIGASPDGGAFIDGSIDEAGLWNRQLTTSEMTSLWNGGAGTTYPF